MKKTSYNKGFTLIEVVASMMVFAIGASISLSFFNLNAVTRRTLEEKAEAEVLASNILKTLSLQHKTDTQLTDGSHVWNYSGSAHITGSPDVYPGHDSKWKFSNGNWGRIPVDTGVIEALTSTSIRYTYYPDGAANNSIFQYNYFVSDISNFVKIIRSKKNWDNISAPTPQVLTASAGKILTVAVTWPKNVVLECDRKRVVISTVLE